MSNVLYFLIRLAVARENSDIVFIIGFQISDKVVFS